MTTLTPPGSPSASPGGSGRRLPWVLTLSAALLLGGCGQTTLEIEDEPGAETEGDGAAGPGAPGDGSPGEGGDGPQTPDEEDPHTPRPDFEPGPAVMPRLTESQYRNTLEAIFGEDLPETPVEADTNPYLFYTIGAATTQLSDRGVEQYADAAMAVAEAVFKDRARREALVGCAPERAGDACVQGFLASLGRRLWRRPLTDVELERWVGVSRDTADGDPWQGLETAVAGLLQSPWFLYRIELGEEDPSEPGQRRYTSWEMAQRLAFLFWNTGPDEELLEAAARGELTDDATIFEQSMRLSNDPRARVALQDFFTQYLDLGRLEKVERDPARYPGYSPSLLAAMEAEVRLLVDDIVYRRDGDVRRLFSDRRAFVNSELAALYGLDAPGATPIAFVPVEFGAEVPRAGLLTLGAFLTMNAHPTETSPTLRGKYIRERLFCQEVPAPPDDIDLNLEAEPGEPATLRERLEQHRRDPACAGCHSFIDPPGMLFEHYDSIGRYRDEVDGHPVDSSGDLDGAALENAEGLGALLGEEAKLTRCMVRQLYRHANGRLEEYGERIALRDLEASFEASGYRFRDLMLALALSEGFRTVAPQAEAPEDETTDENTEERP